MTFARSLALPAALVLGAVLGSLPTQAGPVLFTPAWKSLEFFRIPATEYRMNGTSVEITARQSSSVIYTPLPEADWQARRASWDWAVESSVPPTDLSVKGGDDRNAALYFVFLDRETAGRIGRTASIRKLLTSRAARILVYTFGGDRPAGSLLSNPYLGDRGAIIIRRPAMTGAFSETVDLAADFQRAFGTAPQALVGIALAADSDNTDTEVIASISNLRLD